MAYHLTKTIAVVGLMGAGKSAVGTLVARKLGAPFLDSDREIMKAANMTVAEIFQRDGEAFFRTKETQVLRRLLQGEPCILSTGGGAYMSANNRALISRHGLALWLRAELGLLWNRVKHKDTRPLLRTNDPYRALSDLYDARVPVYALAEIVVDAEPEMTLDQMSDKVVASLLADPRSGATRRAQS